LTAKATDDAGATTTSSPVTIAVADFSVAASPSVRNIGRGTTTNYTITVTPVGGFKGGVTLSVTGLPSGTSVSFSSNPLSLISPSSSSATMTVTTSSTTPIGSYTLTVKGTSGSLQRSTGVSLKIRK